ncbi:MAG: hypothetical protein ACI83O_000902 [Patescibacteria group bacterium]|jgi:hypothetical protein
MKREILVLLIATLLISPFLAAELGITEPKPVYNLGDKLFITVTDIIGSENGNLNIDLFCSNTTINLLKISARAFPIEGGQSYSIPYKYLTKEDLEVASTHLLIGNCHLRTELAGQFLETGTFQISKEIAVDVNFNKVRFNPGEDIELSIKAKRADGEPFNGFYKIENFSESQGAISDGAIEKSISVDSDKEAGEYFMKVQIYDLDADRNIRNLGSKELLVIVNQIPTDLKTSIATTDAVPGKPFKVIPTILDQTGQEMQGAVSMYVTNPDGDKIDYSLASGEEFELSFPTNATSGPWVIYTFTDTLHYEQQINVLGVARVEYTVEGSRLIVKNIGNVNYDGIANIQIGEEKRPLEVSLKMGDSKEYVLEAPEGEYNIKVNDGENSFETVGFLTGNAVGIKELGSGGLYNFSYIWIFIIFIAGSIGMLMINMYQKTTVVGEKRGFTEKIKGITKKIGSKMRHNKAESKVDTHMIDYTQKKQEMKDAESATVIQGQKANTTIIGVHIKERETFSEEVQDNIVKIIRECCGKEGVTDVRDDIIYLIYSPLITQKYKNDSQAVQVAQKVKDKLTAFKRGMNGEFHFGIGIHSGELVSKKEGIKLKYASMDTVFTTLNKITKQAENNILISDRIRKNMMRDLKVMRSEDIGSTKVYTIEEVINREQNKEKLQDLLRRSK